MILSISTCQVSHDSSLPWTAKPNNRKANQRRKRRYSRSASRDEIACKSMFGGLRMLKKNTTLIIQALLVKLDSVFSVLSVSAENQLFARSNSSNEARTGACRVPLTALKETSQYKWARTEFLSVPPVPTHRNHLSPGSHT